MAEVRVRAETAMLGLAVGHVVTVQRTPLVQAAIDGGRLTIIEEEPDAPLRGEALDGALRHHGLSLAGRAESKRRRLDKHLHEEHPTPPENTPDLGRERGDTSVTAEQAAGYDS